jgi:hypothetical protein
VKPPTRPARFGKGRLREGIYTAGQITAAEPTPSMNGRTTERPNDFTQWLCQNIDRLPVARAQIEQLLKRR